MLIFAPAKSSYYQQPESRPEEREREKTNLVWREVAPALPPRAPLISASFRSKIRAAAIIVIIITIDSAGGRARGRNSPWKWAAVKCVGHRCCCCCRWINMQIIDPEELFNRLRTTCWRGSSRAIELLASMISEMTQRRRRLPSEGLFENAGETGATNEQSGGAK